MAKKVIKKVAKVDAKKSVKKSTTPVKKKAEPKKVVTKVASVPVKAAEKKKVTVAPKPTVKPAPVAATKVIKAPPKKVEVQPAKIEKTKAPEPQPEKAKLKILSGKKPGAAKKSKASKKPVETELTLSSNNTKWLQLYKKYGNLEAVNYDMTKAFEEKKPIQHPKLGWGFIVTIQNDRLEVLFQEGTKTLISNYNPDLKL